MVLLLDHCPAHLSFHFLESKDCEIKDMLLIKNITALVMLLYQRLLGLVKRTTVVNSKL